MYIESVDDNDGNRRHHRRLRESKKSSAISEKTMNRVDNNNGNGNHNGNNNNNNDNSNKLSTNNEMHDYNQFNHASRQFITVTTTTNPVDSPLPNPSSSYPLVALSEPKHKGPNTLVIDGSESGSESGSQSGSDSESGSRPEPLSCERLLSGGSSVSWLLLSDCCVINSNQPINSTNTATTTATNNDLSTSTSSANSGGGSGSGSGDKSGGGDSDSYLWSPRDEEVGQSEGESIH